MNTCVHYFSESVYKYILLSNFHQNTFFLNTVFQTTYASTFINGNCPAFLSHSTTAWLKGVCCHRTVLLSRCVPIGEGYMKTDACTCACVHKYTHTHTYGLFQKRNHISHLLHIIFSTQHESKHLYSHLFNACDLGIFWHVYYSFIILHYMNLLFKL